MTTSMRKEWFNFVAVTRKRLARKTKKDVSHREAMKKAALDWPKEKIKILNRRRRAERRKAKEQAAKPQKNSNEPQKVDE